jgi:ankyrin repeat protein
MTMKTLIMVLFATGTVIWSSLAFCGEIQDAAQNGDIEKVEALLKKTPDLVSDRDSCGQTALHWAVSSRQKEIVTLLIADKADVNAKSNSGQTPLHYAVAFCFGDTNMVDLLLVNKADVNAKDNSGKTPLHMAALYGFKDIAALLIANRADVNAKDNNGQTPLAAALNTNSLPRYLVVTAAPGDKAVADLLRQKDGKE